MQEGVGTESLLTLLIVTNNRSLNLSNTATIVADQAWRQLFSLQQTNPEQLVESQVKWLYWFVYSLETYKGAPQHE